MITTINFTNFSRSEDVYLIAPALLPDGTKYSGAINAQLLVYGTIPFVGIATINFGPNFTITDGAVSVRWTPAMTQQFITQMTPNTKLLLRIRSHPDNTLMVPVYIGLNLID